MKILFFGAGVIGSVYAGKLALAGHDVTMLARGRRLEELGRHGLLLKGRKGNMETPVVRVIPELKPDDLYDYVFVALRSDNIVGALPTLSHNRSENLVFMVNTSGGYSEWIRHLGSERVVAAFPGAGGKIENGVVHYRLTSPLIQPTTIDEIDGRRSERIAVLKKILMQAGFPVAVSQNMDGWQKSHVAMICPVVYGIYCDGGDNWSLARNKEVRGLMCRALRENFRFLHRSGLGVEPPKLNLFRLMPAGLMSAIMRPVLNSKWAETVISNHTLTARSEMEMLTRDFLELARGRGCELEYLTKMRNPWHCAG
jgi:2-dehydropantoate 2-reductase